MRASHNRGRSQGPTIDMSSPGCDFCNSQPSTWFYPAPDQLDMGTVHGPTESVQLVSHGAWIACSACLSFIQRGDRDGLVEHVLPGFLKLTPWAPRAGSRHILTNLYRKLLPLLGVPRPITPELAARWRSAMQGFDERSELSARAVAATFEPAGRST
jgi:hypothetical protein